MDVPPSRHPSPSSDGVLRRRRSSLVVLGVLVLVVVVAVAAIVVFRHGHNAPTKAGRTGAAVASNARFSISYSRNEWQLLTKKQLAGLSPPAVVGLRRKDKKALFVIRRERGAVRHPAQFAHQLDQRFRRQLPHYRVVSATIVKLPAGRAFFFSYLESQRGPLDTLVIFPAGTASYVLNTVAPVNDLTITRQIGAMLKSFRIR